MKKNGFIATSLIYSFFMAFIALVMLLLSSYLSNKTVAERYNEEVAKKLNGSTHKLIIYSKNSNIQDGITMTNLINNGNFSNGQNFWTKVGSASFTNKSWLGSPSILKNNSNHSGSYIYQNIYLLNGNKYYTTVSYSSNLSTPLYFGLEPSLKSVNINNESKRWDKISENIDIKSDNTKTFIIGKSTNNYTGSSYFTNAMIINLTASFGKNYEPDSKWLDANLDWFDHTISYYQKYKIKNGKDVVVRFKPELNRKNANISCQYLSKDVLVKNKVCSNNGYCDITFKNIKGDIKCYIDWI